jgi:hypothetical protein
MMVEFLGRVDLKLRWFPAMCRSDSAVPPINDGVMLVDRKPEIMLHSIDLPLEHRNLVENKFGSSIT